MAGGALRAHKIASVVYRLGLDKDVEVTTELDARSGNAIVVRALSEKRVYAEVELQNGRMSKVFRGDVIVGALGRRRALCGFTGDIPASVCVGDRLSILNLGGVVGDHAEARIDLGAPLACEVLGMPVRDGRIVNVADARLPRVESLDGTTLPPIVIVSATGMNAGKTRLISEVTQELSKSGLRVAGGKLTGVACLRDLISMEDHGAETTASFLDVGYPSTAGLDADELLQVARDVVWSLAVGGPDMIVLELGDGILGDYGVLSVLRDPELSAATRAHVFCATDLVGAWGGFRFLQSEGIEIDLFSGPSTDNEVGVVYIEGEFGKPAVNAFHDPEELAAKVRELAGLSAA